MAYTTTDLERIEAAIASASFEVELDNHRVRFSSTDELLKKREFIQSQLEASGVLPASAVGPRTRFAIFRR